jgi:hypothetical protein
MRRNLLALALFLPAAVPAQTRTGPIKPADLMRHMNVLAHDSLEGRAIGTPGGAKARRYLIEAFTDAGLAPLGASFESPFTSRRAGRGGDTTTLKGVNLVGVVRGRTHRDKYIVVTAHYDHEGIRNGQVYNGADDNASGAGALVEIARQLIARPPENSVLIVAFDGEERGLLGARAFVAAPPVPVSAMIMNVNMDMVGRNDKNELYAAGSSYYPVLRPYLDTLVTRSAIRLRIGHDDPNGPRQDNWTSQSDQGAFHAAKIPFIYFGVEDHPDYHKPTDDVGGIMPEFYAGAVNTVLESIRMFDAHASAISRADLTGEWAFTVVTENGTGTPAVTLAQRGDTLTGTYVSPRMGERPIAGIVRGDTVDFLLKGGEIELRFLGTILDGDNMKGTVDMAGNGQATFTAKRAGK